jgi:cell division septal protein FtsQ
LQTLEIHQVVEGKSTLPAIPVGKIRKMLISDPRISNAEVTRIFPDTLRIAITERQPVAVLRFNRNYRHNDLYIDRDGYVIPANISAGGETLPIVIGLGKPVDYPIGQKANDLALLAFLTFLRESKLRPEGSLYEVQLCRLEQENNEMHLHLEARGPFKPSAELVLPTSNIPQNLERIKVIVTLLMEENRTIRYMNAKYDRIPVRN